MRLRTFTARDMPSAMQMVREALGDDAIIISSQPVNGKSISVTAAVELEDEMLPTTKHFEPITARDTVPDELRFAMQTILRFHNVPELFIAKMLQKAADANFASAMAIHRISSNHKDVRSLHQLAMEKLLAAYFHFSPLVTEQPSRLMLIGVPGIGKTLTAAKIATRIAMSKKPLAVITTDNKRAGGIEQLQTFTDILEVELKVAGSRTELWKQLKALPATTHVVIDTAGCNPYLDSEWEEAQSYASIEGVEPLLVLPCGTDSAEAIDTVEIFSSLPIKRMLVTRADATRRFGGILAAAAAHELSFCNASTSASMVDSLPALDAALLAQLLLRYQFKNQ